ncbi:Cytochrome P450 67 [Sparassis crispa]|uniref:Cytochrome P450 67 n=1 Tax=Sparassis crispa TaxID=139825 RepID=A0A401GXZ1_9APHY|nr:Cytochrome P450 67 [Sparassis crispa]GBE87050.1 Cytochrome P450 67 [Sparassis crispa]
MQGPFTLPEVTLSDTVFALCGSAVVVYLIFKRYEPINFFVHLPLLTIPPTLALPLLLQLLAPLQAVFISFSVYYATIVLSVVLYRLSPFHPLAQYPGPFLLKVSKCVMGWFAFQGRTHTYVHELHQLYGDIVRIGPNEVSIRDTTAIIPLMGSLGLPRGSNWRARGMYPSIPSLVSITNHAEHAERRKPWNRAFNSAALKGYEDIIARRATQLVENIARRGKVDLGTWFSWFSFDFMSDMAFGGGSEMMRDGDNASIWSQLESALKWAALLGHIPWLGAYARSVPGIGEGLKRIDAFGTQRATLRVKNGSLSRDLFHHLNGEDGKAGTQPPLELVVADGTLAVIAGSDTTTGVLTNLFFCLLRHPESYVRLQAEVDKFCPLGENALNTKHLGDMVYLNAVLNEALRLYPAGPSGSQRTTGKGHGGKFVGPYYLPEETNASIHTWSVHRDARNFSMPDKFWPERWLIAEDLVLQAQTPGLGLTRRHTTTASGRLWFARRGSCRCWWSVDLASECSGHVWFSSQISSDLGVRYLIMLASRIPPSWWNEAWL